MAKLLYEDKPWTVSASSYLGNWAKTFAFSLPLSPLLILFIAVLILLFIITPQKEIHLIFASAATLLILFIVLRMITSKYQIFNDRIRIVGWIFNLDIPFANIENIREASIKNLWGFHYNYIPVYSGNDVLQIIRKRGLKINIIPGNRKLFLENLNKAMADWRRGNIQR